MTPNAPVEFTRASVAAAAHTINNALTGVLTFAHLMRDKPNLDDQDREDLALIIAETTRAADIALRVQESARQAEEAAS